MITALLVVACASDTDPETSDAAEAPVVDAVAEHEGEHPLDAGCHSHDRGVTFHDLDGVVCEPTPQEAEDAKYDDLHVIGATDLLPAERGEPAPAAAASGRRVLRAAA